MYVYTHTHKHTVVHSLTQYVFLLQREIELKVKKENQELKQKFAQLQVSSVFLACLIQSTSLYYLTGTFIGRSLIISL